MTSAQPSALSQRDSRISVLSRYFRVTFASLSAAASSQRPFSSSPRMRANIEDESKRGQQSQSIEPSRPTRAAVWQSPIIA